MNIEQTRLEAQDSSTPHQRLALLATSPDLETCLNVANNPHTPTATLSQLVHKEDPFTLIYIANNPNTTAKILAQLAAKICPESEAIHLYLKVCHAISNNPKTTTETLEKLATSRYPRHQVAFMRLLRHPNTTPRIRKIIDFVRGNDNTDPDLLKELATNPSSFIRSLVKSDRNTNSDILREQAADSNPQAAS